MIIYKVTNKCNGKIYIGQHHKEALFNYKGSGVLLKLAYKKYGIENFSFEILKSGIDTKEELNEFEKYFIRELRSNNPNIGYNLTAGGASFFLICGESSHLSHEEVINKSRHTKYLRKSHIGIFHSEKSRQKCASNRNKIMSSETIDKIKESNKKNNSEIELTKKTKDIKKSYPKRGHPMSEENYNKMMDAVRKPKCDEHKKNLSKSLKDFWAIPGNTPTNSIGVVVDGIEYISLAEASRLTGLNFSTLRNRCKSKNPNFKNTYRMDSPK